MATVCVSNGTGHLCQWRLEYITGSGHYQRSIKCLIIFSQTDLFKRKLKNQTSIWHLTKFMGKASSITSQTVERLLEVKHTEKNEDRIQG